MVSASTFLVMICVWLKLDIDLNEVWISASRILSLSQQFCFSTSCSRCWYRWLKLLCVRDSHHVLAASSSYSCSSGWDSTGLRPAWEKPHCDTHHCEAWCSSFSISAQLCNNEGAPDSRPAAASEVYYFCFVCEDAVDVSAEFLQIHLGTLIHG